MPGSFAFAHPENGFAIYPKMTRQHVAILLCTYNGEKYIREQIQSIIDQTHADWSLWVSDDGSQDRTLDIIRECMRGCAQSLSIRRGPSLGFSHNFMSLVYAEEIQADYFAFCDQDDIWHSDKIARALKWHTSVSANEPNLYGSRLHLVDADGGSIGESPLFTRPPCFANALVQNIMSGNTMVMNRKARELLGSVKNVSVFAHDWWAYILIAGAGGHVFYDPIPSIDYRQHGRNLIGGHSISKRFFSAFSRLMGGDFCKRTEQHIRILEENTNLLSPESCMLLRYFKKIKYGHLPKRMICGVKGRIFRQTFREQCALLAAIILKKI